MASLPSAPWPAAPSDSAQIDLPQLYNVVLLNDSKTPMRFVTDLLQRLFSHSPSDASRITLATHTSGRGVAGTYPRDIADAKAGQVVAAARLRSFPLRCIIERERT